MGLKDKVAEKVIQQQAKDIYKYLESVGAHLELILETNRAILNEIREQRGKERIELYEDEKQIN